MTTQTSKHCASAQRAGDLPGLTILECLLATAVLAIAGVSTVFVLSAGRSRFAYSDELLRTTRLGEHIIEEVIVRPYFGSGTSRTDWCLDDYRGLVEQPGEVVDAFGTKYSIEDQRFRLTATVEPSAVVVPGLDNFTATGKTVTVRVGLPNGETRQLSRFISEPIP
jgi:hypothetical protein